MRCLLILIASLALAQTAPSITKPDGVDFKPGQLLTVSPAMTIQPTKPPEYKTYSSTSMNFVNAPITTGPTLTLSPTKGGGLEIRSGASLAGIGGDVICAVLPDGRIEGDAVRALRIMADAMKGQYIGRDK